jgi:hypothetical protein
LTIKNIPKSKTKARKPNKEEVIIDMIGGF